MSKEIVDFAISRGVRYENGQVIGVRGKPLAPIPHSRGYVSYQMPTGKAPSDYKLIYGHKLIYYLVYRDERAFSSEYEVHHKNLVKTDNSPDNLELKTVSTHRSEHMIGNKRNRFK